jgi:hypothetical protein
LACANATPEFDFETLAGSTGAEAANEAGSSSRLSCGGWVDELGSSPAQDPQLFGGRHDGSRISGPTKLFNDMKA